MRLLGISQRFKIFIYICVGNTKATHMLCYNAGSQPKKQEKTVVKLNKNIFIYSRKPFLPVKNFNKNCEAQPKQL